MRKRLRKLVYWAAKRLDDREAYNIRARTRREAKALREANGGDESYGPVAKVEVTFTDALDLLRQCLGEGGSLIELDLEGEFPSRAN